jgi:hypothetical protein
VEHGCALSPPHLTISPQAGQLYKKWVEAAGATVAGTGMVFVSPLASYGGEALTALRGATLHTPCLVRPGPPSGPAVREVAPLADGSHVYEINAKAAPSSPRSSARRASGAVLAASRAVPVQALINRSSPKVKADRFADLRER